MTQQVKITDYLNTVRDYLRYAVSAFNKAELFYGHGADNAWDEAVFLVTRTLNLAPDCDQSILDARLLPAECELLAENIQKRIDQRIPSAYILKEGWFAGMPFFVDERVLIPRSPIGELIEQKFSPWVRDEPTRILDLCTGSGCIAIACAKVFENAEVDAVDVSDEALEVAKINVARHHLSDRVNLIKSDVFDKVEGRYDLIISNPPYVGAAEIAALPEEYKHEPEMALAGGHEDGLGIVENILANAGKHLNNNGILIVEVGNSAPALCDRHPDYPFVWLEFERGGHGVFLLMFEQFDND